MRRFNLLAGPLESDPGDPPGFRGRYAALGDRIGAEHLAGRVFELPPGEQVCPYHYELSDEEWLLVLTGRPTVRHPQGDDVLEPGDLVCFPLGPDGAHAVRNDGDEPARLIIVSTRRLPAVAVYPDSDKLGVFTRDGADDLMVRRADAVPYFEGET
jgi:uncharacterized cupin superfamily protein